jgi:hypothetical protein
MWEMDGNTVIGGGAVSPNPGPSWTEIGTGDFFGGGSTDMSAADLLAPIPGRAGTLSKPAAAVQTFFFKAQAAKPRSGR